MTGSRRRVLFALHEPGYFRMYGSTIVEMGRRGWDVLLVFDRPHKRGENQQLPAGAGGNVRSLGRLPGKAAGPARMLRLALDYVRYLEPAFAQAEFLRRRSEKHLPDTLGFLTRVRQLPRWVVGASIRLGRLAERLIPVNRAMLDFVRKVHPDVIVVTPVVIVGQSRQTELIKVGQASNVPVIVGAASWDHLTSKGLIGVLPDALTVWNETQAHEA